MKVSKTFSGSKNPKSLVGCNKPSKPAKSGNIEKRSGKGSKMPAHHTFSAGSKRHA